MQKGLRWRCGVALAAITIVASGCAQSESTVHSKESLSMVPLETPLGQKPRVVVTTDPELDDSNSLVRYLLYSSDYRTEGLIYASSQFHWKGDGKGTEAVPDGRDYRRLVSKPCPCPSWRWAPDERFIDDAVEAYEQAYPNLSKHHPDFPTPAELRSKIRWGNVKFDGEMSEDTPGSDLIKSLLLDDEESPIYLHAWGGQSTIARALKSIEEEYKGTPEWPQVRAKVIRKAVIHPSGDQDDTYAKYIHPNWPEIRYRQLRGGVPLGYGVHDSVSEADARFFSSAWTKENVSSRGSLGAFYRVWGDGRQMVEGDVFDYFHISGKTEDQLKAEGYNVWTPVQPKDAFIGEGDTGTFLNLIDNGLLGYRGDSFGGWGGYLFPRPITGMRDFVARRQEPQRAPTHPFLAAAQRDFAARLRWATAATYAEANHNPQVTLVGTRLRSERPGEHITLEATTSDPDRNAVSLRWWQWNEAGTYRGSVQLAQANGRASFVVPADAKPGDTLHFIAEATDDGTPALTRYEKVVLTVAN